MADAVSICNLALVHIGEQGTIISLDPPEGSEEAGACAAFYSTAVSTLLDAHDWNFATRRVLLSEYADADLHGWQHAFAVPSDCIRITNIRPQCLQRFFVPPDVDFEVIARGTGRVLLTDSAKPVMTYISSETSTGAYSPPFVEALSWYLAAQLAGERVKGKEGAQFAQMCLQRYQMALGAAKQSDARQFRSGTCYLPSWIRVR